MAYPPPMSAPPEFSIREKLLQLYPDLTDSRALARFIKSHREIADRKVIEGEYREALNHYSLVLNCLTNFDLENRLHEEDFWKTLSNHSLCCFKLGQYQEALESADHCIGVAPHWPKGYWRAGMACKMSQGAEAALSYLVNGLRIHHEQNPEGNNDTVSFLTEIVTLIPQVKEPVLVEETLAEIKLIENLHLLSRVIQKLANTNNWDGVRLMVLGIHDGPSSLLDGIAARCTFEKVSVGSLLSSLSISELNAWGSKLAVHLLKNGASSEEIGVLLKKPPVHVGIDVALRTGSVLLLKYLLEKYATVPEQRDAVDESGNGPYHVLINTGNLNSTIGETIVRLFLNHGCRMDIPDALGKLPIQYLKPADQIYQIMKKADIEVVKHQVETLKATGNSAWKAGNYKTAIDLYTEAISRIGTHQEFMHEAAVLYSNRSAVYSGLENFLEALQDALASLNCDPKWHKGYWRKATVLKSLNQLMDAFKAFIDGFFNSVDTPEDIKQNFLFESVCLLHKIDEYEARLCYDMLKYVDKKWWEPLLVRLGKAAEWWAIGYLMIGPDLKNFKERDYDRTDIQRLVKGVAVGLSTEHVPLKTLFHFLKVENPTTVARWLDPLAMIMLMHSPSPASFFSLSDDKDSSIHAAVRFSLMLGRTALLNDFQAFMSQMFKEKRLIPDPELVDENGDTVFHTIAKFRPLPEKAILKKVTELMLSAGFNAALKNKDGQYPVDYLDRSYDGEIFDIFLKACCKVSTADVPWLKKEGNIRFQAGDQLGALQIYSKAIKIFEHFGCQVPQGMTGRDIAALYGNRAAVFLSQNRFQEALDDAMKSVSFDGHWYKSHLRVGRAHRGLGNQEISLRALVNTLKCGEQLNDQTIVEILMEMAQTFRLMPRSQFPLTGKIPEIPNTYELHWYRAVYTFITSDQWDEAHVAYLQACMNVPMEATFPVSLKPLCNIEKAKAYPWLMHVIHYFVFCRSNHQEISFYPGDTYFHAVAYLTIKAGSSKNWRSLSLLQYILDTFVLPKNEQDLLDKDGNTALHVVLREPCQDMKLRYNILMLLAEAPVNPHIKNLEGKTARDVAYNIQSLKADLLFIEENYRMMKKFHNEGIRARDMKQKEMGDRFGEISLAKLLEMDQQAQTQAKVQAQSQAQTQAQTKAQSQTPAQTEAQTKAQSQTPAQTQALSKAQSQTPAQTQAQAKAQSQTPAQTQAQAKVQSQTEAKTQTQTQIQAQAQKKNNKGKSPGKEGSPPVGTNDQGHGTGPAAMQLPSGCNGCDKLIQDSELDFRLGDLDDGYQKLVLVLESQHSSNRHRKAVDRVINIIVAKLGDTLNPEIPDSLTNMSEFMCGRVTKELIKGKKWRQVDAVVRKYRNKNGSDKMKSFATSVDMVELVEDTSFRTVEDVKLHIIISMLSSGASIGKDDGAALVQAAISEGHFKVVAELLKRGASPSALSLAAGDTPIHAALMIGLEKDKGNFTLFDTLLNQFDSDPKTFACLDPSQVDVNGDCLFHLLAKCKVSNTALKVIETLCARKLSSSVRNSEGKLPIDYIVRKNDRRKQFLRLAATAEVPQNESSSEKGNSLNENSPQEEKIDETGRKIMEMVKPSTMREARKKKIEEMIRLLDESKLSVAFGLSVSKPSSSSATKQEPTETTLSTISPQQSVLVKEASASTGADSEKSEQEKKIMREQDVDQVVDPEAKQEEEPDDAADTGALEVEEESDDDEEEETEEIIIDSQVFDDLAWEVECTADVWKKLRDKHIPPDIKTIIVRKIHLLASGEWQPHLCKKLKKVPTNLQLYEAKVSKGGRVLWELAIAFSPRCSETAEQRLAGEEEGAIHSVIGGRIYSEIIRVWDIVLDHDKLYRSIQKSAERIIKSHHRGESCIIQKKLRGIPSFQTQNNTERRIPMLFAEAEVEVDFDNLSDLQQKKLQQYFPPASPNETEYHILKFYSFNSALVSHVLQNIDIKVDFPFRVTDLEHAIITLKSKAPLLLLGRSGTGKTTCCLYRLWSQFLSYWTKAKEAGAPLLPRVLEYFHHEEEEEKEEEEGGGEENSLNEETEADDDADSGAQSFTNDEAQQGVQAAGIPVDEEKDASQFDHIHQIFITKNSVLCSEVQKNFHELSHACDIVQDHFNREADNLPSRLQDVDESLFPLFLTSRQLLLMLDASIGAPYFFDRKEDGSLKGDIQGWSENDGPLSILPFLNEDSDAEEDEAYDDRDDDMDDEDQETRVAGMHQNKVDPRREVTYEVFVDEVWPRIKKKLKVSYHPSLVWTEIMSFIKGSFEALSKPCGYLSKEEYIVIGRKRAPNFSGERDRIYEYFTRYDHFKKQNSLFDETDLVHDIYKRLRNTQMAPWVIHQIFVDETQDFTQAELCLLIRICQNPNQMFLTGDTAQSIMRGISFRFSDLKSLFFHARQSMQAMGKTGAVEVPKQVYQLTHNYRSHAGILSLASSVLDLLVEFFPESFDRLRKDQGLFNGPQPMLLESCSFSDLAVLLRGNRRKTSHIEFGAHQAILVVDEAARESIPEELRLGLILTIYEAKGLEFDDVLLYNFFKDSQASKEWRVVTSYLEQLWSSKKDCLQADSSIAHESLAEIDGAVLRQEGRPRPLPFDANQHKVLNSELKHLYTALTRARVNVWIFDADAEKRAPMFEYFKARKLVKCLTVEELDEANLSDTMFAETSSPADWIRRGDDFMKHALYEVAAKCFGMAGEPLKQKVALAHQRALVASRMKDNPRAMCEEFMKAAELYLECDRPAKAALCLQNARERELAAQLFEKLCQFERAGEIYRRLRLPLASSRCYELVGNFNRAVEVLYENENYDMAIDTLRRYRIKTEEYESRGEPIPQSLITNKPSDRFSEERLSYMAANLFHKYNNRERMLDALDRLPRWQDRVQFLKEKKYLTEAVQVMEENGQAEEAAKLLLVYGKIDQAEVMARKTLQENTIAQTLLVCIQVLMSRQPEVRPSTNDLQKIVKEAKELFKSCKNIDGFAEANLLLAELAEGVPDLTESLSHIRQAWNDFLESKPFVNFAGTLECVEWIVTRKQINKDSFMSLVQGFEHLFKVVQILCCPKTPKDKELLLKYDSFFGLLTTKPDYVIYYPKQKPRCKDMIKDLVPTKQERRKVVEIEIEKKVVNERIAQYLLNRAKGWLHVAVEEVTKMRNEVQQCLFYQVGLPCPDMEKQDGVCPNLHCPLNKRTFEELMEIDRMFIVLQRNIEFGARNLRVMCPASLFEEVEFFLHYNVETSHEDVNSFTSCEQILQDLMPMSCHPFVLSRWYPSEVLSKMAGPVKEYMKAFMEKRWKEDTNGEKIFRTTAARSADVFLMVEFCSHLFSIDFNFDKKLREFETALSKEQNQDNKERKYRYLALMTGHESRNKIGRTWIVESLARRFYDSYYHLTKPLADPMEAVIKFTKFVALISMKAEEVLPDPKFLLIWLEFYTTLSFFLIAKINKEMKRSYSELPDVSFFVPASYLHLMDFIEATFPKRAVLIQKAVNYFSPRYNSHSLLQDRLDHIVMMVCGTSKSTSLVNVLFSADLGNFFSCAMAERVLVLAMTLVSNVGTFTSVKSETALMQVLTQLQPPQKCPKRLRLALEAVQKAQCIRDVGATLRDLLKEREEEHLMSCKWVSTSRRKDQRYHVQSSILTDAELLPGNFFGENTLAAISHGAGLVPELLELFVDHEDETQMSMEEKMKWQNDAAAREKAEAEKEAGMKILRFFRRISFTVRCRDLKARVEEYMVREELEEKMKIFETAKVTDIMCGICNVSFEWLLEQSVKKQVSDSFTIGETSATPDFGGIAKADANVGVDQDFEEQKFTPESQNDVTKQEENSKVMSLFKFLVPRLFNSSGEKSNTDITSKEGEINENNNATLKESNAVGYQMLFSYESSSETGEKEALTMEELKELGARELKKIKDEHIQSQEHMQKQLEFHAFKKLFKEKIEPKCKFMQEYILKYELGSPHLRNTVYSGMQLEISRIVICMTGINHEMNRILLQRSWKTSQLLQQLLGDMDGAYNAVHRYVDESYRTYIQRQEEQKVKTTSMAKIPESENWDDEIEDVVDDPAVKVKSQVFKNRRRQRSHKN
ncbi:hypothetical protein ACJMK2_001026 [Sinanodonta woodiana]|uniref:UvrD-like helicase ATP-binding domain-containing protein n=1 Tax=Sinanodonta woodiana TaxID=1069815 RepID=A0ABD3XSV7_SINWO